MNVGSEALITPQRHEAKQGRHHHDKLLSQVSEWLQAEKAKRVAKRAKRGSTEVLPALAHQLSDDAGLRPRTASESSDGSAISLEKLQRILDDNMTAFGHEHLPAPSPSLGPRRSSNTPSNRRHSSARQLSRTASSDTEYQDGDVVVPTCDVVLDNSKTMSYTGGTADSAANLAAMGKRAEKEHKAWLTFKNEIVRLAHTLRLKGWRRVPLDQGGDIEVERLSGALTNAVYVVSPPKDLPSPSGTGHSSKKTPPKLLLRIYGPQVEHLIDRGSELSILRRLARKKIGPRLLGTFRNGRFEEFFNATTLTSADLRVPDTSKQIAKRMRELHEGIDLLEQERDDGPFVWRNWDKWVDRCEEVTTYLDKQILSGKLEPARNRMEAWKERGLVCGVEWPIFKKTIDRYRAYLDKYYGGKAGIRQKLVFAHNDTQYGNILRLLPTSTSPLLLPSNTHKQLIVIDFEYASANPPGLEFANHFTEWCYNYHDPVYPYICNSMNYPTVEEQKRFIKSYVNHRPQFNSRASATPKLSNADGIGGAGSISAFVLDSRTPVDATYAEEEAKREREAEKEAEVLIKDTRIWRVANSAQWVAWGIVQAKVPELDALSAASPATAAASAGTEVGGDEKAELSSDRFSPEVQTLQHAHDHNDRPEGLIAEALLSTPSISPAEIGEMEAEAGDDDEFDYLGYAQERAMFFWGDILSLGIVEKSELPEGLLERVKIVEY
jgi:choline kinase